jgi:colicin import membrane protein
MEFDEETGRPNYRLHAGLAGRSRALAVAEDRGIPPGVLRRAKEILGEAWERREKAESDAEAALERLRQSEKELAAERDAARREAQRLESERREFEQERSRMLAEGLAGFERARGELARRVEQELDAARQESTRLAQASAQNRLDEAERAVAESEFADARRRAGALPDRRARHDARCGAGRRRKVLSFDGSWALWRFRASGCACGVPS